MRIALLVAAVVAVAAPPADACSVTSTFIPPTNFELVVAAESIVVARVDAETPPASRHELPEVSFTVTSVVKGRGLAAGATVKLGGSTSYAGKGAVDDFSHARPGAYRGGCIAYDYALGKHFLLFLANSSGAWHVSGAPFARVNEEVDPKGDRWTTAVREYARIAALPVADRSKELHALEARADKALAADIRAHFAAPTPGKPFADLEVMYKANPADKRVILAIGEGGDPAAKGLMATLVHDTVVARTADRQLLEALGAYYEKVSDPAALAQLGALYVALGSSRQSERWALMWLLIKRADGSLQSVMEQALAGANDEEAGRLGEWFAKHPSEAARKELAGRVGGAYEAKWEMALGLAGTGDAAILAWAEGKLKAPPDDNRWIAVYVVARSPLPAADALARKIIAAGGKDVPALVQGYAGAGHANVAARLADLEKSTDPEVKRWLERTRAERAGP